MSDGTILKLSGSRQGEEWGAFLGGAGGGAGGRVEMGRVDLAAVVHARSYPPLWETSMILFAPWIYTTKTDSLRVTVGSPITNKKVS